ncbi:hypothetical protein FOA52_012058 [Chlamydomonas sp. UWO 241]|nr:hypothetical protein FOA52_012058 [Chlamydomonas sp. UWO 241]
MAAAAQAQAQAGKHGVKASPQTYKPPAQQQQHPRPTAARDNNENAPPPPMQPALPPFRSPPPNQPAAAQPSGAAGTPRTQPPGSGRPPLAGVRPGHQSVPPANRQHGGGGALGLSTGGGGGGGGDGYCGLFSGGGLCGSGGGGGSPHGIGSGSDGGGAAAQAGRGPAPPPGMINHGNTCYLNATLQVLFNLPIFTDQLTDPQLLELLPSPDQPIQPVSLLAVLRQSFNEYHASALDADGSGCARRAAVPAHSPRQVQRALAAVSPGHEPDWGGLRQQDAHELLVTLLGRVQGEALAQQLALQRGRGFVKVPGAGNAWRLAATAALCPVARAFGGCLQHSMACSTCGHASVVKERISHLSLQLPGVPSSVKRLIQASASRGFIERAEAGPDRHAHVPRPTRAPATPANSM